MPTSEPTPAPRPGPSLVSVEGERLMAALLSIGADDAARVRDSLPPRRRPPRQAGPTRDWGEAD